MPNNLSKKPRESILSLLLLSLLIFSGGFSLRHFDPLYLNLFGANVALASLILSLILQLRWRDWRLIPLSLFFFWCALQQTLHVLAEMHWFSLGNSVGFQEDPWFIPTLFGLPAITLLWRAFINRAEAMEREARIAEALTQNQKLESMGTMAGGIAHQFNNLLTLISGNAGLLRLELPKNSPLLERVKVIEDTVQHAARISNQMRNYAGGGKPSRQHVKLQKLIGNMEEFLRSTAPTSANIRFDLPESLPGIEADPSELEQLVANLLTNAVEASSGRQGEILLSLRTQAFSAGDLEDSVLLAEIPPGNYLQLHLSDPGQGMKEEEMRRMFDPFFSTKSINRGLGLAAALGIIRNHRGFLHVESEPDKGSTFDVYFPIAGQMSSPDKKNAISEEKSPETATDGKDKPDSA